MANDDDNAVETDKRQADLVIAENLAMKQYQAKQKKSQTLTEGLQTPSAPIADDSMSQEAAMTEQKAKPAEQLKDTATDALKDVAIKELKKRFWIWLGGFLAGTFPVWGPIVIGVTICGMIFAFTYDYWQKNAYNPLLYVKFFTSGPTQLIMDAVANTAGKTEYGGKAATEDTKPKPATGASAVGATPVPTTNK